MKINTIKRAGLLFVKTAQMKKNFFYEYKKKEILKTKCKNSVVKKINSNRDFNFNNKYLLNYIFL